MSRALLVGPCALAACTLLAPSDGELQNGNDAGTVVAAPDASTGRDSSVVPRDASQQQPDTGGSSGTTSQTCAGECSCPAGTSCSFKCTGECTVKCNIGVSCDVDCSSGPCNVACPASSGSIPGMSGCDGRCRCECPGAGQAASCDQL